MFCIGFLFTSIFLEWNVPHALRHIMAVMRELCIAFWEMTKKFIFVCLLLDDLKKTICFKLKHYFIVPLAGVGTVVTNCGAGVEVGGNNIITKNERLAKGSKYYATITIQYWVIK